MLILLLALIVSSQDAPPDVGTSADAHLPIDVSELPQPGHCFSPPGPTIWSVHRGGVLCATTLAFEGIRFSVDTACESGLVVYVATSDPLFRVDGVGIDSTFAQAVAQGGLLEVSPCQVRLPSGWFAEATAGCGASREQTRIDQFTLGQE